MQFRPILVINAVLNKHLTLLATIYCFFKVLFHLQMTEICTSAMPRSQKNILISYSSKCGASKLDCNVYEQRVIMLWPKTKLCVQQSVIVSIEGHMKFFTLFLGFFETVLDVLPELLQNKCRIYRCYDNKFNFIW